MEEQRESQETEQSEALLLSVVVPCFNEVEALPLLLPRLIDACWSVTESYEIILVNDGSTDATWEAMAFAAQHFPRVIAVDLSRRFGQQAALSAGLSLCRGDKVFVLDADLQDPPELLAEMVKLMEDEGADVVHGVRRSREGESWFKRKTAACFYKIMQMISTCPQPQNSGDFCLMNRRVLEILKAMPERQRYLRGMIAWMGLNQIGLPYDREARCAGQSHYGLPRMMSFAMDAVASFSTVPLRLAFWFSLGCMGLAFLLLGYVLLSWLAGCAVAGWTSLASMMLLFFALQFFCIGLIGEYVGRIYIENKARPLFIIDEIVSQQSAEEQDGH